MYPLDPTSVAPVFQLIHGFIRMLLLVRKKNDVGIMLKQMGYDPEADTSGSASHNVNLS